MPDNEARQEGRDNGSAEGADRPDWLLDNFGSVEEQARSVAEAQRKMHEATEQRAELERELGEMRGEFEELVESLKMQDSRAEQQAGMSQQEADLVNMLQRAREDGDTRQELALIAHIASLQAQAQVAPIQEATNADPDMTAFSKLAEAELRMKYPDYDEYREQTARYLDQMPGLIPDPSFPSVQQGIDTAYRLAKAEKLMAEDTSRRQAEAQAEADRQQKLQAQGLTGAGARQAPPSEAADRWERILNAGTGSFSEMLREARQ